MWGCEILLPAEDFGSDLAVFGSTLHAVPRPRRYQASREAVEADGAVRPGANRSGLPRYRPSHQKSRDAAALFPRYGRRPQPKLQIAYAVPSDSSPSLPAPQVDPRYVLRLPGP
jgi:hypothetical protein